MDHVVKGVIPSVETSDVGSSVEKALGHVAIDDAGNIAPTVDHHVLPSVGLRESQVREAEPG
jgi:hypothetical protein